MHKYLKNNKYLLIILQEVSAAQSSSVNQEKEPVSVEDFLELYPKLKCQVFVPLMKFTSAHLDEKFCAEHKITASNAQTLCGKLASAQVSGK